MSLVLTPSRKIIVNFEGVDYTATPPKLGDQIELEKRLEEANTKGTGGSELTAKLLVSCGLPEEMVKKLDADQLIAVIDELKGSKKK